ncbi:18S rRNA maturation protein [Coemansia sp. RSA 2559]|nr:18S rRNA maturation protein [Coemansia sp. RSA 2559]
MPKLERNSEQQDGPRRKPLPYELNARNKKNGEKRTKRTNTYSTKKLPTSVNACKKQARDINRLLKKNTELPSTKKVEFERRVKALEILQGQLKGERSTKANASRYHGVKFFERKKVLRKLVQAEKKQQEKETSEARQEVQELLVNLNYTTYYPDEIKYISLYPADPSKTPPNVLEKQSKIREAIRVAMDNDSLPKDPRLVQAQDRKAIRKNNRMLLRTVSLAHGRKDIGPDSDGSLSSASEDERSESDAGKEDNNAEEEDDEFFE